MRSSTPYVAALAAAVPSVLGHGYVTGVEVAGKWYQGWIVQDYYVSPAPKVVGWATTATDSGFVSPSAFQSADVICHRGATNAALSVPIAAGQPITLYWVSNWPEGHQGPVLDYLAECTNGDCSTVDKTTLQFAKLDHAGLISGNSPGVWAEDQLVKANVSWTTTIPASLKPGAYVLRHEIIALHAGSQPNGAQSYPQCINLQVTGSGSDVIGGNIAAESAEKFYTSTDPGIKFDIYNNVAGTYQIPGPTVASFGSGGGSAPASTKSSAAPTSAAPTTLSTSTKAAAPTTTAKTTTAKASTTSAASGGAALYGQCGGQGWNGPTTCSSGVCKASGQYYSQCVPN